MRRKDRQITDISEILEIIADCDCCRLGLTDGAEAYILPMNFGYEYAAGELTLYFHCAAAGRKLDLLRARPEVSFEMDTGHQLVPGERGCDFSFRYRSVMGTGTVMELAEPQEKIAGLQRILAHYTGKSCWDFREGGLNATVVLKLSVKHLSCKSSYPPTKNPDFHK